MQASIRMTDSAIMQYGESIADLPDCTNIELSPEQIVALTAATKQPFSGLQLTASGITVIPHVPLKPAPAPPNINGLVQALLASASLDKSTKDALIAALRGA